MCHVDEFLADGHQSGRGLNMPFSILMSMNKGMIEIKRLPDKYHRDTPRPPPEGDKLTSCWLITPIS